MEDEDKIVEEYLQGKSNISHLYEKSKNKTCPENISNHILSESRSEIQTPYIHAKTRKIISRYAPLAMAATVILAAGIFLLLPQSPIRKDVLDESSTLVFRGGGVQIEIEELKTPEEWIIAIEALKKEKKSKEAKELFEEFKKRYPNIAAENINIIEME